MSAVISIGWFIALVVVLGAIRHSGQIEAMTAMFPEGRAWWHFWYFAVSLVVFSTLVLNHPFK